MGCDVKEFLIFLAYEVRNINIKRYGSQLRMKVRLLDKVHDPAEEFEDGLKS